MRKIKNKICMLLYDCRKNKFPKELGDKLMIWCRRGWRTNVQNPWLGSSKLENPERYRPQSENPYDLGTPFKRDTKIESSKEYERKKREKNIVWHHKGMYWYFNRIINNIFTCNLFILILLNLIVGMVTLRIYLYMYIYYWCPIFEIV
jgi:hypothetical protein